MESSSEEITPRKRATRQRATRDPRKTASRTASSRTGTTITSVRRKPVAPKKEQLVALTPDLTGPVRKAPTPLSADKVERRRKKKRAATIAVLLAIGIGASAAVGYSDKGQIDVEGTIEARNERIRNHTADERDLVTSVVEVPVQNTSTNSRPDGGLVGRGSSGPATPRAVPLPPVSTTTATSSDETASSTKNVASSSEAVAEETPVADSSVVDTEPVDAGVLESNDQDPVVTE